MRYVTMGLCALALAGCSKAPESTDSMQTRDVAAPGIVPTAAPGVAFAYRYAFRLSPATIAATQEAHAQACERLGIARCRITGMRYTLTGENAITAMLAFKLDPAIARTFGKEGIARVETAKGTLVDAEITGTDAAAQADGARVEGAAAQGDIARIDGELAKSGRSSAERAELQSQRAAVAQRVAAATATVRDARASLATTPMTFDYASGPAVRGFDTSAPLTSALDTAIASAQTTLAVLLGIVAVFGPPALLALLLWLAWARWLAPLWRRRRATMAQ